MLVSVKQHLPSRLATGQVKVISLEPLVPVSPLLFPKLFFLNTSTSFDIVVKVEASFSIGPSDDPLLSGNFTNTVSEVTLTPGQRLVLPLDTCALDGRLDKHTITLTNTGTVEEIVHVWLEGLYEESMRVTPGYPSTII